MLKSDIVLITYLRGAVETGYYAIAVGLADILLMLPTVVGTILFPKLSAAPDLAARWRLVRRVLTVMVPATPLGLVVTYFAAGPLILLAYGVSFDPSTAAVGWLLPGIGCYAINSILMNFLASCGMPLVVVYSPLVALLVNVCSQPVARAQDGIRRRLHLLEPRLRAHAADEHPVHPLPVVSPAE